jgi:hypothetical protein
MLQTFIPQNPQAKSMICLRLQRGYSITPLLNSKMGGYVAQLLAPDLVFLIGVLLAATIICYQTYYQLWLSPLAKFPGPLFASVSRYYELYYDGLKPHRYGEKIPN